MPKNEIPTSENGIRMPYLCLAVGARNAGKTTAFYHLTKELQKEHLCDRIFLLSPTASSPPNKALFDDLGVHESDIYSEMQSSSLEAIVAEVETEGEAWCKYQRDKVAYDKLMRLLAKHDVDIDHVDPVLMAEAEQEGWFEEPPKSKYGHRPRLHLFIDDCVGSKLMQQSGKSLLPNVSLRHRHVGGVGISLFIASQTFSSHNGCPRYLRNNASLLLLWKMRDEKTIAQVVESIGGDVSIPQFMAALEHATAKAHGFLCVEFQPKDPAHRFRAGWSEFIMPH